MLKVEMISIVDELEMVKYRINNYLDKINFQDEELYQLSLSIQNYCDKFRYDELSERDKKAYDLRMTLVQINKDLKELNESWCK